MGPPAVSAQGSTMGCCYNCQNHEPFFDADNIDTLYHFSPLTRCCLTALFPTARTAREGRDALMPTWHAVCGNLTDACRQRATNTSMGSHGNLCPVPGPSLGVKVADRLPPSLARVPENCHPGSYRRTEPVSRPNFAIMAPKALVVFAITVAPNISYLSMSSTHASHWAMANFETSPVTSLLKTKLLRCSRLEVRLGSAVGISYSPRQAESTGRSETDAQGNLIERSTFIQLISFPRTPYPGLQNPEPTRVDSSTGDATTLDATLTIHHQVAVSPRFAALQPRTRTDPEFAQYRVSQA
ncbi:hypothetical protein V8F06_003669 [Rhypophila decipiens]